MIKKILIILIALVLGLVSGYFLFSNTPLKKAINIIPDSKRMGFLPYWLLSKAKNDYSKYLDGIYYFGLTVGSDGHIQEFTNPGEKEPGWYALESGKADPFLKIAKRKKQTLSLVVFSGNNDSIGQLIENPVTNAKNMMKDVIPVMKQYGFSDLNLDVEYVDTASDAARLNFTKFVEEVSRQIKNKSLGTLSIDVSPTAFIKNYLVNPAAINQFVDSIVIMGYDYHFPGSYVTGPVAPLFGAGSISEYDIDIAVKKALMIFPKEKIILGAPLYGYEWETIDRNPRSAVIPGTGMTASSARVEKLLRKCTTCSVHTDEIAFEKYVVFKDEKTGTYHQIFYPDREIMQAKVRFAQKYQLGGVALWALGYEDSVMLDPLTDY